VNIVALVLLSLGLAALSVSESAAGIASVAGMSVVWALMDPLFFGVLLLLYADLRRLRGDIVGSRTTSPAAAQTPGS
jgi:uncharacterized sodium:solute symporter family permease YidK